jgi:hypothetical protein
MPVRFFSFQAGYFSKIETFFFFFVFSVTHVLLVYRTIRHLMRAYRRIKSLEMCAWRNSFGAFVPLLHLDFQFVNTSFWCFRRVRLLLAESLMNASIFNVFFNFVPNKRRGAY